MIPNVDFNQFGIEFLPPSKRLPKWIAWIQGLISSMKRLNGIFAEYINGNNNLSYNSGITYNLDDEVVFNFQTFKSLIANNTNNQPDINSDKWQFLSISFIGVMERSRYNFQKLTLEYALNHYFRKQLSDNGFIGFRQPDSPITPTNSDIYISNVVPVYQTFLVGTDEFSSDSISTIDSSGFITTAEVFTAASSFAFNVNIPSVVYTSINSDSSLAEKLVRQFLDRYVPSGLIYNIVTY